MADDCAKSTLKSFPLLKTKAGPRDKDLWPLRLKEEYQSLIQYVQYNKKTDNDWFRLESNYEGTKWFGKCWFIHNLIKYEFDIEFDIPVTYPLTAPEIALPELDGKTSKMFRGGKICLSDHFKPLWGRNVPKFGIAHAMALGLGPWLAVEVPDLIEKGIVKEKSLAS
ncbi:ubiquitin-fold modifier-conjugating enzyme 1 [Cimex lectularius]|uniref:Ubiquitin-fold modifier-conjugating enzyme 1 n=1 Tax=Cimex lectularius TaxID=79782 RepID=A0A8I6REH6_CIMLE|nr:ubiquitin-fold modifier-conjugating enzyme 1 [Cimex lectularius]